jgi:hypothetical protein
MTGPNTQFRLKCKLVSLENRLAGGFTARWAFSAVLDYSSRFAFKNNCARARPF